MVFEYHNLFGGVNGDAFAFFEIASVVGHDNQFFGTNTDFVILIVAFEFTAEHGTHCITVLGCVQCQLLGPYREQYIAIGMGDGQANFGTSVRIRTFPHLWRIAKTPTNRDGTSLALLPCWRTG